MSTNEASQYLIHETLKCGLPVCIRAGRPDDLEKVVAAFRELEKESIYLRFFGPKKDLSADDIRNFREADFINRVILLCTILREGREIVIASGTYVRIDRRSAEIAFIVEEDYQRMGIANRLLHHLGNIADAAGIETFVAEVLPYNNAMLGVFERCGWSMVVERGTDTLHVNLTLGNAGT